MAQVPSRRWSPKDVLSMVRELTKTTTQQRVLSEQGKYFFNTAISELGTLLNNSQDPGYFESEVITLGADQEYLDSQLTSGIITNIDSTAKTITRASGAWMPSSMVVVSIVDASGSPPVRTAQFIAHIASVDVTGLIATYVKVGSGTEGDVATAGIDDWGNVTVIKTFSTLSFDTTTLTKSLDRIVVVIDSVAGQVVYVPPSEFYSISRTDFAHKSYDDDIIYTQLGNILHFRNGANVTPGTKTVVYQRQPDYPVAYDDNEFVDVSDKIVPLLVKRIYTYVILQLENDIPKNLAEEMVMDFKAIEMYAGAEMVNKNTKKNVEKQ